MIMVFKKMIKSPSSRALVIRINLVFLSFFLFLCSILMLWPWPSASEYHQHNKSIVRCSVHNCHQKVEKGSAMKLVLEHSKRTKELSKTEKPRFLNDIIGRETRIGMVNMEDEDVSEWKTNGQIVSIPFTRVSEKLEWKDLFPEWIDEEEEVDGPSCPEIPMPDYGSKMDMVVAKLPCNNKQARNNVDVFRLQLHLIVANLAVKGGMKKKSSMKVVLLSKCMPMVELFRCDELVKREGDWWYYKVDVERLEQKVSLPVGSCNLALPLWDVKAEGNSIFDVSKLRQPGPKPDPRREAYATVLHSSTAYVCGAITLARTLIQTQTQRDLILLLDTSIPEPERRALARAGWTLRFITRIRNPRAEKYSYNEYNYSKLRLWQLTEYDKVVFVDSDILVLRNLDVLFGFPEMSATGNDGSIFNSGIMVIEPSNCTFRMLMNRTEEIFSYNGGDQGFLNEVFLWWHRLPRRVNFLKNFWSNTSYEASVKNQLFGSDPPRLYTIHYLGYKPWACYRDYDCNWLVPEQRVYASDVAHARWWRVYDELLDEGLRGFCGLTKQRIVEMERDRERAAENMGLMEDHRLEINVTDPRKLLFV